MEFPLPYSPGVIRLLARYRVTYTIPTHDPTEYVPYIHSRPRQTDRLSLPTRRGRLIRVHPGNASSYPFRSAGTGERLGQNTASLGRAQVQL